MVALMSLLFIAAAIASVPSPAAVIRATGYPSRSLPLVLALIGTTVVLYNLFLHANTALAKWGKGGDEGCQIDDRLRATRLDTIRAMALGGLVTCAIFTTAARNIHGKGPDVKHPVETAKHLGAIFGGH